MIINAVHPEEFRVAMVENNVLESFFIETATRGKVVGNIYKGIVAHIQNSLQAAFVNYGMERNGFLPFAEIHPEYYQKEAHDPVRIQDVIQTGQEVLVQVVKEELGTKGALLTTYISLAGRDVVLMPGQSQRGVSRKIEDEDRRGRLKELARSLKIPDEFGVIIRTAAEERSKREVSKDLNHLMRIWEEIRKRVQDTPAPALIYKEQDLAIRVIRDYLNPNIKTILIDDKDVHRQVKDFIQIISPKHQRSVKLFKEDVPISLKYNLEDQIEQIFQKRVPLKSGGYLLIDSAEALVAIDVNSGRTNGNSALEDMAYKVNMEAAAAIPRQLRLRDLGGLIVIDFIDMRDNRHAREVERRLKEELKKDKAKITVGRISRFGLLELSRQHLGLNIMRGSYNECSACRGTGMVRSLEASALGYLRKIWLSLSHKKTAAVKGVFPIEVANYLLNQKRADLTNLEEKYQVTIIIEGAPGLLPHQTHLEFIPREGAQEPQKAHDEVRGSKSREGRERRERRDRKENRESRESTETRESNASTESTETRESNALEEGKESSESALE
jgi:ribonuclease E